MNNIAIFASGTGSNFQALINDPKIRPAVRLLVCDQENAQVISRAERENIPVFVCLAKDHVNKASFEEKILTKLKGHQINFCVLAGYMRMIGNTLLAAYPKRIINLHPSFLPEFPGKDAIGQAFRAGVAQTGITAHFVDSGVDTGPIIAQERISILQGESEEELTQKIHQAEHRFYPTIVCDLILGNVACERKEG
ncbi:phosphoribosylglycinamide formyltransferase [Clostridia bacterium]|nr:phosphoribosylglycinamide formyltransferase [Clostridia bacterium]